MKCASGKCEVVSFPITDATLRFNVGGTLVGKDYQESLFPAKHPWNREGSRYICVIPLPMIVSVSYFDV